MAEPICLQCFQRMELVDDSIMISWDNPINPNAKGKWGYLYGCDNCAIQIAMVVGTQYVNLDSDKTVIFPLREETKIRKNR